jgi:hypothetical protein
VKAGRYEDEEEEFQIGGWDYFEWFFYTKSQKYGRIWNQQKLSLKVKGMAEIDVFCI